MKKAIKYGKVKIKTKGYPKEMLCSDNDMLYKQAIVIADIKGNAAPFVAIEKDGLVMCFKYVQEIEPEKEPSVLGSIEVPEPDKSENDKIKKAWEAGVKAGELLKDVIIKMQDSQNDELKDRIEMIESVKKYVEKHGIINTYIDCDYKMEIKKAR